MWSIFIPANAARMEALSTELWEMGTSGIVEEPNGLRAYFDESIKRDQFSGRQADIRDEIPFDVSQMPPVECDPILIGERFYVAPSWSTHNLPAGRIGLTIDTTSAFGSGRHESTQLCVEMLEKHLKPGTIVADIGCGSGILSAAAQALGAASIIACDIHQSSVKTAQTFINMPLFVGSADGLRDQFADFVLANLTVKVLDIVAHDLQRITKPSGLIVIAGFLHEDCPKRFKPLEKLTNGDWECWLVRPQDIHAPANSSDPAAHSQQWWL